MATATQLLSTGQVARALGVNVERLRDLLRRGKIKEPLMVAGRRAWTHEQQEAARVIVARENA